MANMTLSIKNSEGLTLHTNMDTYETILVYDGMYSQGDSICLTVSETNKYYVIRLDDALAPSFVYMADSEYTLAIPFDKQKVSYNPRAFTGESHYLTARLASKEEISAYKNLAANVFDAHGNQTCFPHAFANVETRGEAVFAARNAIDGVIANASHGNYPYQSWGINQNPQAEWTLEFGRNVSADKIVVYLRADFPHDNWWEKMTVTFSDGTTQILDLIKTHKGQEFRFEKKEITWLKLSELIKADDPSPFPALTQLEVYGWELN